MDVPVVDPTSPEELAKEVSLRYVTDDSPGFSRMRQGKGFEYYDTDGNRITERKILDRIEALSISPAWEDVWICPLTFGHIQATGRDEKRRKQYIYHERWKEVSNQTKFDKMLSFSEILPILREKVTKDMNLPGLKQERIIATVVWLLDNTYIRIGNEEYAKTNEHFGLTTLRSKHVDIHKDSVTFEFTGKSGKDHEVEISHPKVIKIIKRLEELPGYELFKYLDETGEKHTVDSQDVNDYIRESVKENFTAKDFRTWGGTVLAGRTLKKIGEFATKTDLQHNLTEAVRTVAKTLGNTPKVCRSYYIHPTVVATYKKKILVPHFLAVEKSKVRGLDREEYATTTLLQKYS